MHAFAIEHRPASSEVQTRHPLLSSSHLYVERSIEFRGATSYGLNKRYQLAPVCVRMFVASC